MDFLYDLATAHKIHEGWFPSSRSWRNNNPGNLRAGPPSDKDGFTIYKTYAAGFKALGEDIEAKICGRSRHIDYSKNPTFLDYIRVYAPADDGNSPTGYCQSLCRMLQQYELKPDTPLTYLCSLARQGQIKEPVFTLSVEAKIKALTRALQRATGQTKVMLTNTIKRLKDRLKK